MTHIQCCLIKHLYCDIAHAKSLNILKYLRPTILLSSVLNGDVPSDGCEEGGHVSTNTYVLLVVVAPWNLRRAGTINLSSLVSSLQ